MSIKQNGGVFGRNPTFNDVTIEGDLIINGEVFTGLDFQGSWNASTNSPTLASSVGTNGEFYIVSIAGTTDLNGITNWGIGDWAIFNGTVWQRVEGGADGNFNDLTANSLNVNGTATMDGLNVAAGSSQLGSVSIYDNDTDATVVADSGHDLELRGRLGQAVNIYSNGSKTSTFESNGDISFYETTGSTPKMVWKASDERLGIGTDSPTGKIDLGGNTAGTVQAVLTRGVADSAMKVRVLNGDSGTTASQGSIGLDYGNGTWADMSTIKFLRSDSAGQMAFYTSGAGVSGTEKMRIDSSGSVGIGTESPSATLTVQKPTGDGEIFRLRGGVYTNPIYAGGLSVTTVGDISNSNRYWKANCHTDSLAFSKHITNTDAISGAVTSITATGIAFNGDTGAANSLDDYEEGTWTPAFTGSDSGTSTQTVVAATYTKIGRAVHITCYLAAVDVSSVLGASMDLTGLPFTCSSYQHFTAGYSSLFTFDQADIGVSGYTTNGSTSCRLLKGSSTTSISATAEATTTSGIIMITFTYQTNA